MKQLELLAPARDYQIGIAAIDCGADAVYIAGPQFGARQAAGNQVDDIRRLCEYAHRFGVRIFVTLNTILYDDELEAAYRQMLAVQEAGADAIIVQDLAIVEMARNGIGNMKEDLHIPLHASTQCAIRTP
ncbi:MAG: U32 family peptidase, partial [Bacteroidales bacterium]|nr:U32 family peptidase [Bacteroidales bacterium]